MSSNKNKPGKAKKAAGALYVVATPIGNLADLSERARSTLTEVDLIAAEDTRHTARMLTHLGVRTELISCHEHNETERAGQITGKLQDGLNVALVSDAGTPLMSDPGYRLVKAVADAGLPVVPVPGACAAIAALSVAGLPSDQFRFVGFLPSAAKARQAKLQALAGSSDSLLFYVSVHKLDATLGDMITEFGADRPAVLGREITKLYETFYRGDLAAVREQVAADPGGGKGELTLVVAGCGDIAAAGDEEVRRVLTVLLEELPASQAAALAAKLTGRRKREVYELAMSLKPTD